MIEIIGWEDLIVYLMQKFVDKAVQVGESCDESARSNRRGSRDTSRVMKRLEAVKKDLHKLVLHRSHINTIVPNCAICRNELVLRDSNLVMGRISPQEELNYRYKH